jgi:polysaccharide biosynthesis/export protein
VILQHTEDKMFHFPSIRVVGVMALALSLGAGAHAQQQAPEHAKPEANTTAVVLPPGYLIGPQDVLSIVFWRDKDMSADVVVRPDGKISLPLLNEIQAAGFTPEQLRARINESAGKFVQEPNASVVVKDIRSRFVFITGGVNKPGTLPLMNDMNVLQLIALAGGLQEFADSKNILIIRTENGRQQYHKFNYKDVVNQRHVEQNITLRPGDTVVVP